jgi:Heterokaryon incompatibility protein (HET)
VIQAGDTGASLYDSDDEDGMLDYAMALSLDQSGDAEHNDDEKSGDEDNRHQMSCVTCKRYPKLPRFERPRKFRIIQFEERDLQNEQLCSHYVAISYCWQSDPKGNPAGAEKHYRVRVIEKDGSYNEQRNRASDEVIDRAVDAARAIGARLIWLDQECLPQDASREQELGIQAMDMVYQRAHLTFGLFQSVIQEQGQLDAAASILDWALTKDPSKCRLTQLPRYVPLLAKHLMDFLELFAEDQWNRRAWILQEVFSSGDAMVILIRTTPSIQFRAPSRVTNIDPRLLPDVFSITMPDALKLIAVSKKFLTIMINLPNMTGVSPASDTYTARVQRSVKILDRLDQLYPDPRGTTNRHAFMHALGGSNFGPRKTCTAAVALSFLRSRSNHRPADRLAMLANLCDYEIRLDTVEIEKRFKSSSVCLFTLAFINGDVHSLSLMFIRFRMSKVRVIRNPFASRGSSIILCF